MAIANGNAITESTPLKRKADSFVQYRYVLAVLGFLAFAHCYTMRVNLSVAIVAMVVAPSEQNETDYNGTCPMPHDEIRIGNTTSTTNHHRGGFAWDANQQNLIQSIFFYGYVTTNVLAGRIAEMIGTKWVILIGIMFSSLVTLFSPLIADLGSEYFAASRVLVGLGLGVVYPAMHCSLGAWYPQKERGLMYSIIHSGARFSAAVTFPVSGLLCASEAGWPSAFYVFGAFGAIWCIIWWVLMYDNPENHPFISEKELKYITSHKDEEGQAKEKVPFPLKAVLTSVPVWMCCVSLFGTEWGFNTLIADLPTYMSNILHFDIAQNGLLCALPYICDMIFTVLSGIIADWLLRRKCLSVTATRKLFTAFGSFLPAACLLILTGLGCDKAAIIAVMTLAVGFGGTRMPGSAVAIVDIAPNFAGTIMGICNGFGQASGFIALPIVGAIMTKKETQGEWDIVFSIAAGVYIVTAVAFLIFGTAELQPWSKSANSEEDSDNRLKIVYNPRLFTNKRTIESDIPQ